MSILLLVAITFARPLQIAVIDTGIDFKKANVNICKNGLIDFTETSTLDTHGHGSNIASIIADGLNKDQYCLIILKYYDMNDVKGNSSRARDAFNWVNKHLDQVDIVNMSGGGPGSDLYEEFLIRDTLDSGVVIIAAAGNDSQNLDEDCYYYPACYDSRIIVVGNGDSEKKILHPSSNYGKIVDVIVNGINVCAGGSCMTGTSQSTAKVTNSVIKEFYRRYNGKEGKRDDKRGK